jgi:hypothetical protein
MDPGLPALPAAVVPATMAQPPARWYPPEQKALLQSVLVFKRSDRLVQEAAKLGHEVVTFANGSHMWKACSRLEDSFLSYKDFFPLLEQILAEQGVEVVKKKYSIRGADGKRIGSAYMGVRTVDQPLESFVRKVRAS